MWEFYGGYSRISNAYEDLSGENDLRVCGPQVEKPPVSRGPYAISV